MPRALLVLALLAAAGCAALRDADYVEQDIRRSGGSSLQPLLEFFETYSVPVQSQRVSPPTGSSADAVYSVAIRFDNQPSTLAVYTYPSAEVASRERQRFDYGLRVRSRRQTRTLSGRVRESAVTERAPVYQRGALVVVVHGRDVALERALREAFGPPTR